MTVRVAMVLRAGGKHGYSPEHVERLCLQLDRYLPGVEQLILSDTPCARPHTALEHEWAGWWSKMELFRPDIKGDLFYLDLDTTLVDDIAPMAAVGVLAAISHRGQPSKKMCSGVMYLPENHRKRIWAQWIKDPGCYMRTFRGDQDFLFYYWGRRWRRFEALVPGCAVSFKYHVAPAGGAIHEATRLVYWHGDPKPWQLPELVK